MSDSEISSSSKVPTEVFVAANAGVSQPESSNLTCSSRTSTSIR